MGQSLSVAYPMRKREDTKGSTRHRKSQAHAAKTSRHGAADSQSPSGGKGQQMEAKANLYRPKAGDATKVYFMRCPDLGQHAWQQVSGPALIYAATRMYLARVDHDEAYPVALGGKSAVVEVRFPNSSHIQRFACKGSFFPKYECERA